MKTIVIIQARMGSSRLPGKVLKPLGSTDVLTYVISRCRRIKGIENVIVATSTLKQDDEIEAWCKTHDIPVYRGSEDDVLDRYVQCAKKYNPEYVMRVTADCPFVDYEMASEVVQKMKKEQVDIIELIGKRPRGLPVELLSFDALKYIHMNGNEPRHREHVTYYAKEYTDEFLRTTYEVPQNRRYSHLRITLDTIEDYQLCQKIANHFDDPLVSSVDVINYLLENPEIAKINAHIKQKPVI